MQRNGSKVLLLICALLLLTGCPAIGDWDYEGLPGDYLIAKVNSNDICLIEDDGDYIVERFIVAFCYNSQFIGLKRVLITTEPKVVFDPQYPYTLEPDYYLIDSQTSEIHGPWTEEEYSGQLVAHGISDMCEWISTAK